MADETGYAEGWKPNPGDEITGRVIDIAATDGGWGMYPIVTLRDEGGTEIAVHAFHDVLKSELARRRPKVGDEVSIKYLGQPNGKNYHAYRVRGGQDASFDWGAFGGQSEERQTSADPPIQPSVLASASVGSSAGAAADDFSPLPPAPPKSQGEEYGDEPPF